MKKLLALTLALCLLAPAALAELSAPGVFPLTDEPLTLSIWMGGISSVEDYATNYQTLWYEELTNVKLELTVVNSSEVSTKYNLSIASGAYPDMYFNNVSGSDLLTLRDDGVIIPLNDLIEEHSVYYKANLQDEAVRKAVTAPDGNIYSFYSSLYNASEDMESKLWVYSQWLRAYMEATGNEKPTDTEGLRAMLEYFRDHDMNGNGDPKDEIPLTGSYQYWSSGSDPLIYLMNAFVPTPSRPIAFANCDEEGNFTYYANLPEFREGLQYIHGLYKDGLIAEETYVQDLAQFRSLTSVSYDNVVVGAAAAGYPMRLLTRSDDPNMVDYDDYELIEPLTGPHGVKGTPTRGDYSILLRSFVTTHCENPALAVKWMDYWFTEEMQNWSHFYGQEGVHWEWADEPSVGGDPRSVKRLVEWGTTQNIYWARNWGSVSHTTIDTYLAQAASGAVRDFNVWSIVTKEPYAALAYPVNVPQIIWCTDPDLITEWGELHSLIQTYVVESATQFIVGVKDIFDDAAWEAYLRELDNMGLARYIEVMHDYHFGD